MPTRDEVVTAVRASHFQGIAYVKPVTWDAKGDNTAAVIMLNVVKGDPFKESARSRGTSWAARPREPRATVSVPGNARS
jgi:hypothetical protein